MNEEENEHYRRYVKGWERTGAELERIRREERRSLDDNEDWSGLDALGEMGVMYSRPRMTRGLVEMQKWFLKLAQQQGVGAPTVGAAPEIYPGGSGDAQQKS